MSQSSKATDFTFFKWKDNENGTCELVGMCTYEELYNALEKHLNNSRVIQGYNCYEWLDYFSGYDKPLYEICKMQIPQFRWIYCWVTPGSNEGHYFHIECFDHIKQKVVPLFIAKTLSGNIDIALQINNAFCEFLLIHNQ